MDEWHKQLTCRSKIVTVESKPAELPAIPDCYIEPAEETDPDAAGDGVRDGDDILASEADHNLLARVATKALHVLEEVLDTPTPPQNDPMFPRILATKKDAAVSAVGARLKADENCFRKRNSDALTTLYETVSAALGHRPGMIIEGQAAQALSELPAGTA